MGLGVQDETTRRSGMDVVQQPACQAVAACRGQRGYPADAMAAVEFDEDAQVGHRTRGVVQPDVAGARLGVASVQLGVRALLFDDEHVYAELQQVVEGSRVEVPEPVVMDGRHGSDASPAGFARPVWASEDGSMPITELPSGIHLCHEAFGDPADPVLLLMHGLGSQLLLWEEGFCDGLAAEGFRVVRYDHRDSGCSTILEEGSAYTLSDQAADAVGLLDHLGAPDAHVVGLSMGGMIAQTFAVEHPDRCRSMVSMASNTGNRDFGRPSGPVLEAMMAPAPADPTAAVEKELADRRLWASIWHDDDHARLVFAAYAERSLQPRHAFDRQVAAALAHGNREERLATIAVPTLVLHGTADNLITLGGGQRTAEAIPGADLVVVEGWGHDLAPGAWPQLIEAISTHCHRVDGTD